MTALPADALAALDDAVEDALAGGGEAGLRVLGYGEISTVVAWGAAGGEVACKRLPPFPDLARFDAYRGCVVGYLDRLRAAGVEPVATAVQGRPRPDGTVGAYCVQPRLPGDALLPSLLARGSDIEVERALEAVIDRIVACVSSRLGLDGHLSNWAQIDGALRYLDVSTPLERDDQGHERLDGTVFLASLPWALRGVVSRFLLRDILDKYYDPRGVVLDLLGNLHKEGLHRHVPRAVEIAAARIAPAITADEVRRYYRGDARTWAFLQRARRFDRFWQRRVRRRVYPFLLPGRIDRRV